MISRWYVPGISSLKPCLCSKVCPQREVHSPPRGKLHQVAVPYLGQDGLMQWRAMILPDKLPGSTTSLLQQIKIFGHCSFGVFTKDIHKFGHLRVELKMGDPQVRMGFNTDMV